VETGTPILEKEIRLSVGENLEFESSATPLNPDYLGAGGSFLCLVHCIAPQLIAFGSVGLGIGSFFAGEIWTLFFWITCLVAVWQSARRSMFVRSSVFLWLAFGIFSAGIGYEVLAGKEHFVSYAGSLLLIAAHTYNLFLQNRWKRALTGMIRKQGAC
jgi:hypothetical protein